MYPFEYRNFRYDRSQLLPGVVHLGFGAFARAFIADILDDVAEKGFKEFGLVAVAPSQRQARDFEILGNQKNIFHLLRQNSREICQRIGILCETIIGATHATKVIDTLANMTTQIVTLTITSDGYFPVKPKGESTLIQQQQDLSALHNKNWAKLQTPPAWIVAALYQRFQQGQPAFVVMSCDNFLFNGQQTHALINRLSDVMKDPAFSEYVETQVLFPNTAVDRITPKQNYEAQTAHLRNKMSNEAHIKKDDRGTVLDQRPVISEDYRELVIHDTGRFPANIRQAFSSVGVKFVGNIEPYQDRKVRILNGAHMLIGVLGKLLQIGTVAGAMKDREIRNLMEHFVEQAADSFKIDHPESENIESFVTKIIERFENPHLPDDTGRLVSDTHTKVHARLLNSTALKSQDYSADTSAFAIAAWVRYLQARDESMNPYSLDSGDIGIAEKHGLNDIYSDKLQNNLCRFLASQDLSLASDTWQDFTSQIVADIRLIQESGLRMAIQKRYPGRAENVIRLDPRAVNHG